MSNLHLNNPFNKVVNGYICKGDVEKVFILGT